MDEAMTPAAAGNDLVALLGTVDGAMTESPVAVSPEAPLSVALAILDERRVGGAPVVHGGRVVGVVTITDLVGRRTSAQHTGPFLRPQHEAGDWSVADVMTGTAVVASPGEPLVVAVVRMDEAQVDRLPVVDPDGRPVGILARGDVLRAVARAARHGGAGSKERRPFLLPD
ncbi:MAG: CBS domain-containing protein [Actinomycetota bacterium]